MVTPRPNSIVRFAISRAASGSPASSARSAIQASTVPGSWSFGTIDSEALLASSVRPSWSRTTAPITGPPRV